MTRTQGGEPTTELVVTSYRGGNAEVFPRVLSLYVPRGAKVADVTWGKGVFWKNVPEGAYEILATDLQTGVDCRDLPYADESIDAVILDPPYMEGLFRSKQSQMAGKGTHSSFRASYSDSKASPAGPKYHDAVLDLYLSAGKEAARVLKDRGILIVKCQDEVSANRQRLTHVEIINEYEGYGFQTEDIFVVTRTNRPGVSRMLRQRHARKNHSYFLVFWKSRGIWPGIDQHLRGIP